MNKSNYCVSTNPIVTVTGLTALYGVLEKTPRNDIARVSSSIQRTKAMICVKNSLEYMLDDLDKLDAYNETTRNEYRHIFGMFGRDARKIVLECYWLYSEVRLNRLIERCIDDD